METKLSTNHQRFKDLLPKRELEERLSTRETRLRNGRHLRKRPLPMRRFSPSILRKRRLLPRKK